MYGMLRRPAAPPALSSPDPQCSCTAQVSAAPRGVGARAHVLGRPSPSRWGPGITGGACAGRGGQTSPTQHSTSPPAPVTASMLHRRTPLMPTSLTPAEAPVKLYKLSPPTLCRWTGCSTLQLDRRPLRRLLLSKYQMRETLWPSQPPRHSPNAARLVNAASEAN